VNYLEKLLDGAKVEWKPLGEVCERNSYKQIGAAELEALNLFKGDVKLLPSSKNYDWWTTEEEAGNLLCEGEVITLGRARYANLKYYKGKFVSSNNHIIKSANEKRVLTRFLFHFIREHISSFYIETSTYPKFDGDIFDKLPFPLVSLAIQTEIVRILDAFTSLTTELTTELTTRKKQYNHYRNQLFTFDKNLVDYLPMGQEGIGKFIRGSGLQKKDFTEMGVGCMHYGQIYTHYGTYTDKTKTFISEDFAKKSRKAKSGDLIIATTSENDEDVCKAVAWLGDEDIAVSSDACFYTHSLNPKYVAHFFQTEQFQKQKMPFITGAKVKRVNADNLAKILIPIPSPEEQARIVAILDKFDALTNSISEGLPREIALRQKQYEYYRTMLLNFPKPEETLHK